ncbi:hypothetical protein [Amycolatopsis sp. MEPSY49]|uniref:hypothetical protein n=1 Tax=Amycolatopsis sp. MEPSY49 TaxID=3151600 RepID=UPI003EF3813D
MQQPVRDPGSGQCAEGDEPAQRPGVLAVRPAPATVTIAMSELTSITADVPTTTCIATVTA